MKSLICFFAFIIITLSSCGDDTNNDETTDTAITIISPDSESIVQDSITILCESNNNNLQVFLLNN